MRLEDNGNTQVCYKDPKSDPLHDSDRKHLTTTLWDHPFVNRPSAAQTIGLTGAAGVYAMHGGAGPRMSGGFTVYRPDHWVFEGTDLYYGDVVGSRPTSIVAFEVDGLDYTFRNGLPEPTYLDGALKTTEILAMTPTIKGEEDHSGGQRMINGPIGEFIHLTGSFESYCSYMYDEITKFKDGEGLRSKYGSSMIVTMTRGKGMVFDAGTSSWINGLEDHAFAAQITGNVLDKLSRQD